MFLVDYGHLLRRPQPQTPMKEDIYPAPKYATFLRHIQEGCKQLNIGFELVQDGGEMDIDDGVVFNLDGIPYFVSTMCNPNEGVEGYYAAYIHTTNGGYWTPPESDEVPLKFNNNIQEAKKPEQLVGLILGSVMDKKLSDVMEHLVYLDMPDYSNPVEEDHGEPSVI